MGLLITLMLCGDLGVLQQLSGTGGVGSRLELAMHPLVLAEGCHAEVVKYSVD